MIARAPILPATPRASGSRLRPRNWAPMAAAMLLTLAIGPLRAELTVNAMVNRNQIYQGESVLLTIEVRGASEIESPDLSALKDCRAELRGSQSQNSFSLVQIGGQSPQLERRLGRDFIYEIFPSRTGDFTAGPITVSAEGRTARSDGPTIRVMGVEAQDWVTLEVRASRESVLVDESFEVEALVGIRQLADRYAGHDPLNPPDPPRLGIPFLKTEPVDGLEGPDVQALLQQQLVSRPEMPGFALNDFTVQTNPFDSMFNFGNMNQQRAARFMFPRTTEAGPKGSFHTYHIRLTYRARKEGNYTFGPIEFKGQPIVGVGPGGQIESRPVFATGPAVVVRVVPPPEEGRPESYIGAIGTNIVVTASLDSQTCNVGDPLTLSLDVTGDISLGNLSPPVLSQQPELAERFRVYDDTVQSVSRAGGKTYRYTIRPTRAGTYELPPIEVSYYDSTARAYRAARTAPIPVRANETAQVGGGMILSTATNMLEQSVTFRTEEPRAPAPITVDPSGAQSLPLMTWAVHGTALLAGPTVLLLALFARGIRSVTNRRSRGARSRLAQRHANMALSRLTRRATTPGDRTGARAILGTYLVDRLDAPVGHASPSEIRQLLASVPDLDPGLSRLFSDRYEQLFNAEFASGTAGSAPAAAPDIAGLIRDMDAALRAAEAARARGPREDRS